MAARYLLLPVGSLHAHEAVDLDDVGKLVEVLRTAGVLAEPIWVADGFDVILNGHHRYAAVQRLGTRYVPAWALDYFTEEVRLDRWEPGPPISKEDVIAHARAGRLFPPKTTRHTLGFELPSRPTPLSTLFANGHRTSRGRRSSRDDARSFGET